MIKIAHISDIHLHKISRDWSQFFSKRWLGNLNLVLFRKKRFCSEQVFILPNLFKQLKVNYVIVTGDISSTSMEDEFEEGKRLFLDELKKRGIDSFFIPGNHDCYTKKAQKEQTFYKYFETEKNKITNNYTLRNNKGELVKLNKHLWYIGLDCSPATHLVSSRGLFSKTAENTLQNILKEIPKKDSIILACHFPFQFKKSPRKALKRAQVLKNILENNPNIKIFLHGHTHHHKIYDMRSKNLPLVLDSGTAANNKKGKWNLLTLKGNHCNIDVYDWKQEGKWKKTEEHAYKL